MTKPKKPKRGPKLFGVAGEREGNIVAWPSYEEWFATVWRDGSSYRYQWSSVSEGNYDTESDAIRGLRRSIIRTVKAARKLGCRL